MTSYPLYRLHAYGARSFVVDAILGPGPDTEAPGFDPDDDWTHTFRSKTLAATTTREAALAALRLAGAEAFQDWTEEGPRLGHDSPLTKLTEARAA